MIKAILLDLDDTLLNNADGVFVPEYLRQVEQYCHRRWNYPHISRVLLQFQQAAASLRDLRQTNTHLAETLIAEATRRPVEEVRALFVEFYTDIYPQLRGCTEPAPLAADLFRRLQQQNYAIVIATNPLYPAEAIRQRLAWAGLPDDLAAYALVTHSDNMHFIKPDPAYYAEIIARVGVEPDEALMVGDNPENDIAPAALLGLSTYYITGVRIPDDPSPVPADASGSLHDFYQMTANPTWAERFSPLPLKPAAIEPQLRGNVGALFGLLDGVQPHHWNQHPDPDEWSIMEIVCHLLTSEDTIQRARLERILAEDNPFLSAPKTPPRPGEAPPCDSEGYRAAERFMERRLQTIQWLARLRPQDWQRPARHSIFGLTSLLEMAQFTAQHDRLHLNQLCQTLGRCSEE